LDNGFGFPQTSPDGNICITLKTKLVDIYVATQQNINLTEHINTKFWNTRDDHPASRPPFGLGGWTKGDKEILLYDEYNIGL